MYLPRPDLSPERIEEYQRTLVELGATTLHLGKLALDAIVSIVRN